MDTIKWLHLFIVILQYRNTFAAKEGRLWEYCPDETFDPECLNNGVIVMEKAMYGHIKIGRCVDEDLVGHLGCYTDQLAAMDTKCSGKRKCEVDFRDTDMDGDFPCTLSKALARYLEASYICQKVFMPTTRCQSSLSVAATSRNQYISSHINKDLGCGLESTPVILEAKEEQSINITLIDFNWKVKSREDSPVRCPIKYGYMIDISTNDIINLCGGLVRERSLFLSQGHSVQLVFGSDVQNDNFLIKFAAVGCPKLNLPPNTWMKESNGDVTVGCTGSDESWKMRCIGNYWLGPQKDCSEYMEEPRIFSAKSSTDNDNGIMGMPPLIAFSVFGGLFLVIASVVLTSVIGIICIRSRKSRSSKDNEYYMTATTQPVIVDSTLIADQFPTYRSVQVKLPKKQQQTGTAVQQAQLNLLDSQSTLPGSVPRHPPSLRESPHYYLLEGRDTTETEPLYDVVYQGLPD